MVSETISNLPYNFWCVIFIMVKKQYSKSIIHAFESKKVTFPDKNLYYKLPLKLIKTDQQENLSCKANIFFFKI